MENYLASPLPFAHNAVYDALYSGYVGQREVGVDDYVVFTASTWRDDVWAIQTHISDALQDVAYMLKRWKGNNKYRFSNAKTRLLVDLRGEARRPAPEAEGASDEAEAEAGIEA